MRTNSMTIIAAAVVLAGTSGLSAEGLSAEQLFEKMKLAEDSLQTFSCDFTVTYQQHVKHGTDESGRRTLVALEPNARPAPVVMRHEVLVSGSKFCRRDHDHEKNPVRIIRRAWDGKSLLEWGENWPEASKRSTVRYLYGARIHDPRAFAFQGDPERSLLMDVKASLDAGELKIAPDTLNGREVIRVEAKNVPPDDDREFSHILWIDPARNYLPVKIETSINGKLALRWYDITHAQVSSGVWFPIAGTMDNIEYRLAEHQGQVNTRMRMAVRPESINLSPPITEQSFTLVLPADITLRDLEEEQRLIREGKMLPEMRPRAKKELP